MDLLEYLVLSLMVVLLGLWNGLVIKWYLTREDKYSKAWHTIGFIVRALPLLLIYDNLFIVLCYLNFAWTAYNMAINVIIHESLFYVGKTSFIDKTLGKSIYYLQSLLWIITIAYGVLR